MAENSGTKDKSFETLDFVINVLREHEVNLDKMIDELSEVVEKIGYTSDGLKGKVEKSEEKIGNLQKEMANLAEYLSNASKKASSTEIKEGKPLIQTAPAASSTVIQGEPNFVLRCNQWIDFRNLAMHAKKLSFCYQESEKVFQANAITGNQMIIYVGVLPTFSRILKKWLSEEIGVNEQDVLEGFLDKSK